MTGYPARMPRPNASFTPFATAGINSLGTPPPVTVLAASARLPDILPFGLGLGVDGFFVGDLRPPRLVRRAELPLHAVHNNLQVQLPHSGDDRVAGFLVRRNAECGIFIRKKR